MIKNNANSQKRFINKTFLVFSCILFLIITLSAIAAYSISARQINRSFIEQQLSIASETIRLRLATTVNSELALVLKMADTPVIRRYFMNPFDPVLKIQAQNELSIYQKHFDNKMIFWVSDVDKVFYSTGNDPYIINPDDPESYWYNLTLYETEKFNFNINYNPNLDQIYLWVNVPVFADIETGKKPIGMLGTGIDLTDFSNFVASSYREFDENITTYIFNKYNEITSAVDYELVQSKVRLDEHMGITGKELINAAHALSEGEKRSFIYNKKIYLVNSIPTMEWYLIVSYPQPGFWALNRAMNTVFFGMLFLILFMFVVINIFIARSENAIAEQNLRLLEANRKAESASRAKSDFLAKMSHEIRTPMNAITGMAELLLRGELSVEAQNYAQDIKRAGNNLVSIINDILDFSKIEAGKLEIIPINYLFSSLINDTVNIIRMRLMEKPIRFFTNIDGNIPNSLIGDEVRLRQILLNLLINAVKYSEKGHIGLTVTMDKLDNKQVRLRIAVADTGRGIKPEDKARLFGEFVKVDVKKNQGIEGTGLGLTITKSLCMAMGGDISIESEYGKGSVFTAVIPQGVETKIPFAAVEDAEKKKVLVYEGRLNYAKSLCWTLDNLNVPYTMVTNEDDFTAALYREQWFYVFTGYGLYEKIKRFIEKGDAAFCGGRKPPLALMIEWGTEAYIPGVRFVSIPVQSLSISNVLNGKADSKEYIKSSWIIRFIFPYARILVVDDIATNLKVVEGLLAPYKVTADTCMNSLQAIELVKRNEYDIIFMDHMMPEMDGIVAVSVIRSFKGERFRNVPIIALTANAVVGMREMFIKNGFNDFLSKPIDVSKLDEILDRWIPAGKKEYNKEEIINNKGQIADNKEQNQIPDIPGVDTAKGIAMTGGKVAGYLTVLSMFCKDVENRLSLLKTAPQKGDLSAFIINVHALKSSCASIGSAEVSALAAELEAAGKADDLALIEKRLPDFTEQLAELAGNIRAATEAHSAHNAVKKPESSGNKSAVFIPLLRELASALKSRKANDIDRLLEELIKRQDTGSNVKTALEKISDEVLMTEYGKACIILEELFSKMTKGE